ncbi:SMI1/KNR4 family protein [Evansella cellulosilytica]|uniref:Cell wall assembly/cell proliferation coordinating protein, KNR4-like protein n=1 Tax=Evansella cellulosilytica (strain ATCC 21833 / DSM 2522 / FERM P-1141 / JCM 9156 / N-4) TaxID=649639 RepID=E6TT52_EVAC2|nr:SMI1/KNR4 family protein [Evansella cellulosilytica]ADU31960.1 Cell wall assembly/cell proliferation coordinating protein, KNR4-like protein [Evansella cellulosilytica DSM 2522]
MEGNTKLEWRFVKNPATEKSLNNLENEFDILLPSTYRILMKLYNGGRPKPNKYYIQQEERVVKSFLNVYPVKGGVKDVVSWLELPQKVIPFANDPFGNYLCFDYRNISYMEPTIVLWEHEKNRLVIVEQSFEAFLRMLKKGVNN